MPNHLLDRIDIDERDTFTRLVDDVDDDGEISLAKRFGAKLRKEAAPLLNEEPPSAGCLGAILLAGFGDWSAIKYLRQGHIDTRLTPLELPQIDTPHQRLMLLKDLGQAAQIIGATLAIGFDQVENTVRLGDEKLFLHAIVQAVRIAEAIPNCSIAIVVLAGEYDRIGEGLPSADRDRIEHETPPSVHLAPGSPEFLERVVAQRLSILRGRAALPEAAGSLEPLPRWFWHRVREARSVRIALREVSLFREKGLALGRIPKQSEYERQIGPAPVTLPDEDQDYDKFWADWRDTAPAVVNQLLVPSKAALLAWWAYEASREQLAGESAEVSVVAPNGIFTTHVVEIRLREATQVVELRQVALCEAANRNYQLANQVQEFLDACTGSPALLRTKGFPKGRTAQVAPALRKLEAMAGLLFDLSDTEWHIVQRARDFAEQHSNEGDFLDWRTDRQWLTQLIPPLQSLITLSRPSDLGPAATEPGSVEPLPPTAQASLLPVNGPFPVLVGRDESGNPVIWDPYRDSPNQLNNFGFLVTGDAGSGKTQTIRVLIDAACKAELSVCIFDFKADYCEASFADPLGIKVIDVRQGGIPFNPLQPPPRGASGVQPVEHAFEIAGVLARVFKLGPVQEGNLRDAINQTYEAADIPPREWIDPATTNWPFFDQVLDVLRESNGNAPLLTKLSIFAELNLFPSAPPPESFETFINKRICLKLTDLPTDEIKSALAEIIIIQLHGFALRGEQPRRLKRLLVFDEAHRVRNSPRLESLAREGRAFGVGVIMGTQFPGDIPDVMAGNLATQLFLMNNQAQHRSWIVKQIYGTTSGSEPKQLLGKLKGFKPFDGLFSNSHYQMALLRVLPHHQRQ